VMFRASAKARAHRFASNEGLSGQALKDRIDELMLDIDPKVPMVDEALEGNEIGIFAEIMAAEDILARGDAGASAVRSISRKAKLEAQQATFTDELGKVAKMASKMANAIPGGRILFPFIKTPTKLLIDRFLMERTPAALMRPKFWKTLLDPKVAGSDKDQALGQLATGTSLMWAGYQLALQDRVTGDEPADPAESHARKRTGWRPRSLFVGGRYIEIGRLDPMSSFFVFGANLVELSHNMNDEFGAELEKDLFDHATIAVTAFAEMAASKSWLASMGQLINAIESDDPDRVQSLMAFYAGAAVVPNFVTFFANGINPQLIRAESFTQQIQKRLFNAGIKKRDAFGKPVSRTPQMTMWGIPMSHANIIDDPVSQKLLELDAFIKTPGRRIKGVEMTLEDHDQLMQILEIMDVHGRLQDVINDPGFQEGPRVEKGGVQDVLMSTYSEAVGQAQEMLLFGNPELGIPGNPELRNRVEQYDINLQTMETGKTQGQLILERQGVLDPAGEIPTFNAGQ